MLFKLINSVVLVTLASIPLYSQNNVEDPILLSKLKKNEIKISNSAFSETDYFMSSHPNGKDLILTSLQHKFNYNKDNITCPIYFSSNGGTKWERSLYKLLPDYDYSFIFSSESPKVVMSSDGSSLVACITTSYKRSSNGEQDRIMQEITWAYSYDKGNLGILFITQN